MPPVMVPKYQEREEQLEFRMGKLERVLSNFKNHEAPGPDQVRMELCRHLPDGRKEELLRRLKK
eukprot:1769286-Prorocentrum_lima.AAC.1